MSEHKSVSAALAAVMGEIGGIAKMTPEQRRKAGLGGGDERGISYAYRGIDQIAAAVQPLLAKHGVVIVPQVTSYDVREIIVNQKPWTDTTVTVQWQIFGPAGDPIHAATIGLGRDNSDKGANKAITQAFKNLLLRLLCIGDPEDDVDGHTHERDAAPNPDEVARSLGWESATQQADAFDKLRKETNDLNADAVKEWAKAQHITKLTLTGVQSMEWADMLVRAEAANV